MVELHLARQTKGNRNSASQGELLFVHLATDTMFPVESRLLQRMATPCFLSLSWQVF
jgi:hypothetical protein